MVTLRHFPGRTAHLASYAFSRAAVFKDEARIQRQASLHHDQRPMIVDAECCHVVGCRLAVQCHVNACADAEQNALAAAALFGDEDSLRVNGFRFLLRGAWFCRGTARLCNCGRRLSCFDVQSVWSQSSTPQKFRSAATSSTPKSHPSGR